MKGGCFLFAAGVFLSVAAGAEMKVSSALFQKLAGQDSVKAWVFFKDKGSEFSNPALLHRAVQAAVSAESRHRRARRSGKSEVFDYSDLPVNRSYLEALANAGARVENLSRWLNTASVWLNAAALERVRLLPFVDSIRLVAVLKRIEPEASVEPLPRVAQPESFVLDYGPSFEQLSQINVPVLHRLGLSGKGVLVAMFDTGFLLSHITFDSIRLSGRILATRDFIHNDNDVVDLGDADGALQRQHGTLTFSALAGFSPGSLIGPAFGASFILAKTEFVAAETVLVEEDDWVSALEWADSLGAEVVSSSLGYFFSDDGLGHTQSEMDGNTAVITVAADLAMSKGILVVSSAGNERGSAWGTITAPADGDSVLAVGAVNNLGQIAGFSSPGPSADGRIKPDVCARGFNTACATSSTNSSFGAASGTSLSCPLVAGAAALLFESDTAMTPFTAYTRLRATASRASNPDNDFGYGIINAFAASGLDTGFVSRGKETIGLKVYPNPTRGRATIRVATERRRNVQIAIFAPSGEVVWREKVETIGNGVPSFLFWNGDNQKGEKAASGVYFVLVKAGDTEQSFKLAVVR
jgi:subtilisin family serine protease